MLELNDNKSKKSQQFVQSLIKRGKRILSQVSRRCREDRQDRGIFVKKFHRRSLMAFEFEYNSREQKCPTQLTRLSPIRLVDCMIFIYKDRKFFTNVASEEHSPPPVFRQNC